MSEFHAAVEAVDLTPRWKRRLRERLDRGFFLAKIHTYNRFIYRHHMRLIHRFGWHSFTYLRPMHLPGEPAHSGLHWCQWCGERRIHEDAS